MWLGCIWGFNYRTIRPIYIKEKYICMYIYVIGEMSETKKKCKECNVEFPIDMFYKNSKTLERRHAKCKPCFNQDRNKYYKPRPRVIIEKPVRVKKPTGFTQYSEEKRKEIIYDIHKTGRYRPVALKHGIKYVTFMLWVKKGLIPKYEAGV